jgi:hypothetical protein
VAGNIVVAWVLTLPFAAGMGAVVYGICRLFGNGATGPVIITLAVLIGLGVLLVRRVQHTAPAAATS